MRLAPLALCLALCLALTLASGAAGCQQLQTAPPAYRFANQARFNAVKPMLDDYATLRPERAARVGDVVRSWEIEVDAQQGRVPTTQPAQ